MLVPMLDLVPTPNPGRHGVAAPAGPDVEIVVPVYNEETGLGRSIRRLHRFLSDGFPFSWRIVIADNASTDGTTAIAQRLADELPEVEALRLDAKGRGRALRAAWSASPARAVAYMDVDLSTDLRALLPLVAPLREHQQLGVEEPPVVHHVVHQAVEHVAVDGLEPTLRVAEPRPQDGVQDAVVRP